MEEYPLVSFIVGVYNTKNFFYLDKSIDSMLKQTYPNVELIICDDASNNGTYEYLKSNYGDFPNIKIIRNDENRGLGFSLNRCLKCASGKYIARHDDDDYIELDKIEKQVDFLNKNKNYQFVSTGFYKFDKDGIWDQFVPKEKPEKRDFRFHSQHVHAATVFTKACLEDVNGYRIASETQRAEDYDLFMRLYAKGYRGYNIQEMLYYYNYPRGNSRKLKYRVKLNEAKVRYKGFKELKLPLVDYIFVLRPLVAGLLTEKMKIKIKKFLGNRMSI